MPLRAIESCTSDEAQCLHVAAIVGVATLAWELERLGFSDSDDSLADARGMRTIILRAAEAVERDVDNLDRKAASARRELQRRREARGEA
jgi:hypothetical protein